MRKIIINADDFGLNPKVNDTITDFIKSESISSATILANSEYLEKVCSAVSAYSHISFGIHLNLTQGPSLTNAPLFSKYGITDTDGYFVNTVTQRIDFSDELIAAIKQEWMAQCDRLCSIGIRLSHIDGHHHVHAMNPLREVLIDCAKQYDIRVVRSRYKAPLSWKFNRLLRKNRAFQMAPIVEEFPPRAEQANSTSNTRKRPSMVERMFNARETKRWQRALKRAGITTTDYFGQYSHVFNMLNQGARIPENCTFELMCHPGHPRYTAEAEYVKQKRLQHMLEYKLSSFNNI